MRQPLPHLRNLAIASLAILLVLVVALQPFSFPVLAQVEVQFEPDRLDREERPNQTVEFTFSLINNVSQGRTFDISVLDLPANYVVVIPTASLTLAGNGGRADVRILVTIPDNEVRRTVIGRVRARDRDQTQREAFAQIRINVDGPTPTPTNTPVGTNTPTFTATPTVGLFCEDAFEPDNRRERARVIDVNTNQERTICPAGDEDWLVFGGVGGKIYTIDIIKMSPGLDLTLELFDADGNSLAFNDDFFDRDPPDPFDMRPRIQSWQSPRDAQYFIRVRDAAGRGAPGYTYTIALLGESYGITPVAVPEICLDRFEPDGLPEQAPLITSNEIQENRRLCPDGDADWVTFFGSAGKRYFIYTDTRRYRGAIDVNPGTQAGADTIMLLTDRDGISVLDMNDDIPGGNTLDSQIEFIPEVDGFYFVQVKNVGDIGGPLIRYDLVLQLCVPGQTNCGRPASNLDLPRPPAGPPQPTVSPTFVATPVEEFLLNEISNTRSGSTINRATATPTSTATSLADQE